MSIKDNIEKLKKEIPKGIAVVAAAKTRSVDEVKEAIDAGIKIIGENYVNEAEEKYAQLKGKTQFHCIGHLQANKIKRAVEIFDLIQTVDSFESAKEIGKRCGSINKIMPVLIEVNSGKEPNKAGVTPENAVGLVKRISELKNIKIKGLMTMGPLLKNPEEYRPYFKTAKKLFEDIKSMKLPNVEMEILSMGMSDSYKIAVEEGANMVRVGTLIFGPRS